VRAASNGSYSLDALPDGSYLVYAGEDRDGDAVIGSFHRRWGARGGSTSPTPVTITESSIESANFTIGYPVESESNNGTGSADPLPVGGYAYGTIASGSDVDVYRFSLPAGATILVETDAVYGACGYTGQVDTALRLLDSAGGLIATHDDVNTPLGRSRRVHTTWRSPASAATRECTECV
jgi:hypothetical protein